MFAQSVLLFFFVGTLNAYDNLSCDFNNNSLCSWSTDPRGNGSWTLLGYEDGFLYTAVQNINDTAQLLSSTYDSVLGETGCFSMDYRINVGEYNEAPTLRVYQKPEKLTLEKFDQFGEAAKRDYLLFEIRAKLSYSWYKSVSTLKQFHEKFQIIIEGAGDYLSLGIDNVAILLGSECAAAVIAARTPSLDDVEEYYVYTTTAAPTSSISSTTTTSPPPTTTSPPPTTTTQRPRGVNDSLSCDFDGSLCGWSNDPQATGIWESLKNWPGVLCADLSPKHNKARSLSPTYERVLEKSGCFSLDYRIYNTDNKFPTLKIYQKPEKLALEEFRQLSEEAKKDYLLFEIRAKLNAPFWFKSVSTLRQFHDNFQIIIEGTLDTSYYANLAIDNVTVLQGSECAAAIITASTPPSDYVEEYYLHTNTLQTFTTKASTTSTAPPPTTAVPPPTTTSLPPTTAQRPRGVNDSLSCDFDGSLCGWSNDPQATGIWESLKNWPGVLCADLSPKHNKARSLSPTYERVLEESGCFSVDYRIYNTDDKFPTLKIYQKPEKLALEEFRQLSEEAKKDYLLFEIRAKFNVPFWYKSVSTLRQFKDNFQIIIEGTLDTSYYANLAIDNVTVLQGSECAAAVITSSTPPSDYVEEYYLHTNTLQTFTTKASTTSTALPPTTAVPPPTTTSLPPTTAQRPRGVNDSLSCEFDGSLCGWSNDPQATGIWESLKNWPGVLCADLSPKHNKARSLSPTYERVLEESGCFSVDYRIYNTDDKFPTLKIYQKPEKLALEEFHQLSEEAKKDYLLFEIRAKFNAPFWYKSVSTLRQFNDNFQIIIEGTLDTSFYANLAIDNVTVLQGSECAAAIITASTPPSDYVEEYYLHTSSTFTTKASTAAVTPPT